MSDNLRRCFVFVAKPRKKDSRFALAPLIIKVDSRAELGVAGLSGRNWFGRNCCLRGRRRKADSVQPNTQSNTRFAPRNFFVAAG